MYLYTIEKRYKIYTEREAGRKSKVKPSQL